MYPHERSLVEEMKDKPFALIGVNSDPDIARAHKAVGPPKPTGPVSVGLNIGNEAPEIEAEDLDGETFKLSDYRGKVVMLDFWGDW